MRNVNWVDLGERAGWTVVQAFAGVVVAASSAAGFGGLDWRAALLGAGSAGVLSVLKCLGVSFSGSATAGAAQALTSDVVDALAEAIGSLAGHTHVQVSAHPQAQDTQAMPSVAPASPAVTGKQVTGQQPLPVSPPPAATAPTAPAVEPVVPPQPSSEASIAALSARSAAR